MSTEKPNREEALILLKEYNQTDSLIKHALAVEAVMRYFARKRGEDEENKKRRLETAGSEIATARQHYDHRVVNDDLDRAVREVIEIIKGKN